MHHPVMCEEVISSLNLKPGDVVLDATVEGGDALRSPLPLANETAAADLRTAAVDSVRSVDISSGPEGPFDESLDGGPSSSARRVRDAPFEPELEA